MNLNPDLLYAVVRERQHSERNMLLATRHARPYPQRLSLRLATVLRTLADRLDPEARERRVAEPPFKRQLHNTRNLLARYDATSGRVVYERRASLVE